MARFCFRVRRRDVFDVAPTSVHVPAKLSIVAQSGEPLRLHSGTFSAPPSRKAYVVESGLISSEGNLRKRTAHCSASPRWWTIFSSFA